MSSMTPTPAEVAQRRAATAADEQNKLALERDAARKDHAAYYSEEAAKQRAEAEAARNLAKYEEGQRLLRERNAALAAKQDADQEASLREHLHRLWLEAGGREAEFARQYPKLREQYLMERTMRAATGQGTATVDYESW